MGICSVKQSKPISTQKIPITTKNSDVTQNTQRVPSKRNLLKTVSRKMISQAVEHVLDIGDRDQFGQKYTLLPSTEQMHLKQVQNNVTGEKLYAIVISLQSRSKVEIRSELIKYTQIDHPNIIRVVEYFPIGKPIVVFEGWRGLTLYEKFKSEYVFSKDQLIDITFAIINGIACLHKNGIVHKFINPKNIVFSQTKGSLVKLIGFDLIQIDQVQLEYRAPEQFGQILSHSMESDMWSCGVVLYQLFTGINLFLRENNVKTKNSIQRGTYINGHEWDRVPPSAQQLIEGLLTYDKHKRITSAQAAKYSYVTQFNLKDKKKKIQQILSRFSDYKIKSNLAFILQVYIVDHLIKQRTRSRLTAIFQQIDQDGDGKISQDDMIREFGRQTQISATMREQIFKQFKLIDIDRNGSIELREFLVATCSRKKILSKKNIQVLFDQMDGNASKSVTCDEIKRFFWKAKLPSDTWKRLFGEQGLTSKHNLTLKQFSKLLL